MDEKHEEIPEYPLELRDESERVGSRGDEEDAENKGGGSYDDDNDDVDRPPRSVILKNLASRLKS